MSALLGSGSGIKAGTVEAFAGDIPAGWLECNGAAISRAAYAKLFLAIGETYGAGDGAATFNLPDLRGEFIRGLDGGRGVDAGRVLGDFQDWAIENIIGRYMAHNDGDATYPNGPFSKTGTLITGVTQSGGSYGKYSYDFDASRAVKASSETRPRNVAMRYGIKY